MARTVPYTRTRRMLMQAVMWLVLGATVAVAALVRRANERPVLLNPPEPWGRLEVRLPRGWATELRNPSMLSPTEPMTLTAAEPLAEDEPPRVVTFFQQRPFFKLSPTGYVAARGGRSGNFQPMQIAGRPGVRVTEMTQIETGDGAILRGSALWACTVTESGYAVAVRIEVLDRFGRDDEKLLQQLADGIKINELPQPAPKE